MTTIEHPLPIPQLYDDVITLFALSGTGSTPTHIVNYGGVFGEQYVCPMNTSCCSKCLYVNISGLGYRRYSKRPQVRPHVLVCHEYLADALD